MEVKAQSKEIREINLKVDELGNAMVLQTANFGQLIEVMKRHSDGLTRFTEETTKGFSGLFKALELQTTAINELKNMTAEREKALREVIGKLADEELMDIILDQVSLMENTNGVELNSLLRVLKSENDIGEDDALRLIEHLKKDNLIYEPKKGYFKRNN